VRREFLFKRLVLSFKFRAMRLVGHGWESPHLGLTRQVYTKLREIRRPGSLHRSNPPLAWLTLGVAHRVARPLPRPLPRRLPP